MDLLAAVRDLNRLGGTINCGPTEDDKATVSLSLGPGGRLLNASELTLGLVLSRDWWHAPF